MTMLLLPSNSLNSKLVASSSTLLLLRKLASSVQNQQRRSHFVRMDGAPAAVSRSSSLQAVPGKQPVLLIDVMGTLVRDPFYQDIPAYFGMTMKELLAAKHPTAWVEFECGHLTEEELLKKFFADGRDFDLQGLKECISKGYVYLDGVEELLRRLLSAGYSMHAFSNYPYWYTMIEDKLQLSQYMPWTFVSCHMGLRKPESEIYWEAARQLKLDPSSCVFVDDRRKNVEAAMEVGMRGIVFQNAKQLEEDLVALGCSL